jgi:hypothetical protein
MFEIKGATKIFGTKINQSIKTNTTPKGDS